MAKPAANTRFERQLRCLLRDLCVELGFCIPPSDIERIATVQHLTAEEFADEVLRAEGFNPDYEEKWRRNIRQRFIDRFGARILLP
jgi:hypothetical protein